MSNNGTYIEAENSTSIGISTIKVVTAMPAGAVTCERMRNNLNYPPGDQPATYELDFPQKAAPITCGFADTMVGVDSENSIWYGLDGSVIGNATTPGNDSNYNWTNKPQNDDPNDNGKNPIRINIPT